MRRPPRPIVWLLAVTAAIGVGAAGSLVLHEDDAGTGAVGAPRTSDKQTVQVARRDIIVVIALDAVTVPLPTFRLLAPAAGTVQVTVGLRPGRMVGAGATVFRTGSRAVNVPVAARLLRWRVRDGDVVGSGVPVAELQYLGFGLIGSLPASDSYRLLSGGPTATGSITDGPAGFRCAVLQTPSTKADDAGTESTFSPEVMCAVPPDVRAFPDLKGQIAVKSGQATNVPALPVTSVSGGADHGEVSMVLPDGSVAIREVGLGATDGAMVQITSGLEVGARVLASPPPLLRQP